MALITRCYVFIFYETVYMNYALVVTLMSHYEDFCHFRQVIGNYTAIGVA